MKDCLQCGASNATRAQFCNACGARFRVTDAVSAPRSRKKVASNADETPIDLRKKKKKSNDDSRSITPKLVSLKAPSNRVESPSPPEPNPFWTAASAFCATTWRVFQTLIRRVGPFFAAVLRNAPTFFAKLGVWLRFGWEKSRPLRAKVVAEAPKYVRAAWSRTRVAFAPSATWTETQIPNFLPWSVVEFFLWRFPFSIVGIFYAILANEAKRGGDFELARARAARAKGWLIADLALGLAAATLRVLF